MIYSEKIATAIRNHLENENFRLVAFDEIGSFGFVIHIPGPISFIQYVIRIYDDTYIVKASCPLSADPNDPAAMSTVNEFNNRASSAKIGYFDLDFNDGEISYICNVLCGNQIPDEDVIRRSISVPASMFVRYGGGIIDVLFHGMSAKDAVDKCENDDDMLSHLSNVRDRLIERMKRRRDAERRRNNEDSAVFDEDSDNNPNGNDRKLSFAEFARQIAEADRSDKAEAEDADDSQETDESENEEPVTEEPVTEEPDTEEFDGRDFDISAELIQADEAEDENTPDTQALLIRHLLESLQGKKPEDENADDSDPDAEGEPA